MNATVDRTFIERRVNIMQLEEWLKGVGSLALKEIAGDALKVRETSKPGVIKIILSDKEATRRALESKRLEEEAFARIASYTVSATEEWAERFALPW